MWPDQLKWHIEFYQIWIKKKQRDPSESCMTPTIKWENSLLCFNSLLINLPFEYLIYTGTLNKLQFAQNWIYTCIGYCFPQKKMGMVLGFEKGTLTAINTHQRGTKIILTTFITRENLLNYLVFLILVQLDIIYTLNYMSC